MAETLGPLMLFAAAMCLTPGPNVVMSMASAVNFGFCRTIPQISGVTVGFGLQVLAAGLGLASLFQVEPRLHEALKYIGVLYLLYLAWRIANAGAAGSQSARARPINFVEGMLITWVNPKGWVTTAGALAAFTTVDGDALLEASVIAGVLAAWCGDLAGSVGRFWCGNRALPRAAARADGVQLLDGRAVGGVSCAGVQGLTAQRTYESAISL